MTISRDEFDNVVRELRDAVAKNAADLKIQIERIAQLQAELDLSRRSSERRASRKKSAPQPTAIAADERR